MKYDKLQRHTTHINTHTNHTLLLIGEGLGVAPLVAAAVNVSIQKLANQSELRAVLRHQSNASDYLNISFVYNIVDYFYHYALA